MYAEDLGSDIGNLTILSKARPFSKIDQLDDTIDDAAVEYLNALGEYNSALRKAKKRYMYDSNAEALIPRATEYEKKRLTEKQNYLHSLDAERARLGSELNFDNVELPQVTAAPEVVTNNSPYVAPSTNVVSNFISPDMKPGIYGYHVSTNEW